MSRLEWDDGRGVKSTMSPSKSDSDSSRRASSNQRTNNRVQMVPLDPETYLQLPPPLIGWRTTHVFLHVIVWRVSHRALSLSPTQWVRQNSKAESQTPQSNAIVVNTHLGTLKLIAGPLFDLQPKPMAVPSHSC